MLTLRKLKLFEAVAFVSRSADSRSALGTKQSKRLGPSNYRLGVRMRTF